jgi:hypothetical protein
MQRMRVTAVVVALASAVALTGALSSSGASAPARASGAFAWLHPALLPAGWNLARTPGGAALAYPPGWRPRQFRPQHNRAEGQRDVRLLAAIRGASFRSGRGACVIDSYTTSKTSYREIACLVSGARSSAVVVAAAPTALFDRQAATLQWAVSSFAA